jgi:hypothetical protein
MIYTISVHLDDLRILVMSLNFWVLSYKMAHRFTDTGLFPERCLAMVYIAAMCIIWPAIVPKNRRDLRGLNAIIGTPITENPSDGKLDGIDVVRTVRSFDPCVACCVGVYTPDGQIIAARELEHIH